MGEEEDQAALAEPLVLPGGDELVEHDLCAIDEVTELGLPEHERVGVLEAVAVLEA